MSTPTWINVKDFGAVGNGVKDDYNAIMQAVNYAKLLGAGDIKDPFAPSEKFGAVLYFPPGEYMISKPIVLPRSGARAGFVVHLVGDNPVSSIITGMPSFPPSRALIEWEAVAKRTMHQRISNLALMCPPVDNTMAIWYKPVATDMAKQFEEYLSECNFTNLVLGGTNDYQRYLMKIDGLLRYSNIEFIRASLSRGQTAKYNTILIYAEPNMQGGYIFDEQVGISSTTMKNIEGGSPRGGYCTTLWGRFHESSLDMIGAGGGSKDSTPSFNFINSGGCLISNLTTEGLQEMPQMRFENCMFMTVTNINLGSPDGTGVGDGIYLIGCEDCTFQHRKGNPWSNFTTSNSKAIKIDARSKRNRFLNFQVGGPNEIQIDAPADSYNFVQAYDNVNNVTRQYGTDIFNAGSSDKTIVMTELLKSADQSIPKGTAETLITFQTVNYNQTIFNKSTNRIAPAQPGFYRISASLYYTGVPSGTDIEANVSVNLSPVFNLAKLKGASGNVVLQGSEIIYVDNKTPAYQITTNHSSSSTLKLSRLTQYTRVTIEFLGTSAT